jgi:peptidoglycan/LPS O-acetylase OafA/YrhL
VLLPLFLLLIYRCAVDRSAISRGLSHPILVRLGEASYAVYILHIPLFVYWHGWLRPQRISTWFTLTYLAIITIISLAVYAWLEKPMAKWVRHRFAHVAGAEPSELRVRTAEAAHPL